MSDQILVPIQDFLHYILFLFRPGEYRGFFLCPQLKNSSRTQFQREAQKNLPRGWWQENYPKKTKI